MRVNFIFAMLAPSADCYLNCHLYAVQKTLRFPLIFITSGSFMLSVIVSLYWQMDNGSSDNYPSAELD